ncbi:DUF1043 domain-containing protein [Marinomonas sp. A79]|uniref:DUF1043 domain-containing protein n=1 Tax=Marinomonas vulgaris TaxID=2823372 RepID=A0ABS5H8F5_9GAMM|nr:DUF1043 domain-containing protein [Marinomonas vulgaris]MBR7887981.1 DUF1043 domain-containing protein [Marinomonas vulgaris]
MNLEEFNIIIFITGIIIGCVTTIAFKSFGSKNSKQANSNIITMKSLQQELDNKQVIIDNFFADSQEHIASVEKRLADFRKCLADNAGQLSNITIDSTINTTTQPEPTDVPTDYEPPRDYALKSAQEPGMLSDQFGLKDEKDDVEPKRTM